MNFFHKRFDASTNQCVLNVHTRYPPNTGETPIFSFVGLQDCLLCCSNLLEHFKRTHVFFFSLLYWSVFSNLVHYDPKVVQSLRMLVDMKLFSRNFFTSHFESQGHCKVTNSLSLSHLTIFSFRNLSFSLGIVPRLVQLSISQPVHHFRHEAHKAYIIIDLL